MLKRIAIPIEQANELMQELVLYTCKKLDVSHEEGAIIVCVMAEQIKTNMQLKHTTPETVLLPNEEEH